MSEEVVKQLEEDKKQLLESLQYAKAELANLRRLMDVEVKRAEAAAKESIALKLINFYEDFERVVAGLNTEDMPHQALEAIYMLFREFENILKSIGVERMDVVGKEFNPFDHEAVEYFESEDFEKDTVVEVVSNGYRLGDKILKIPKVRVARPKKSNNT